MISKIKQEIKEGLIEFSGSIFWYIAAFMITIFVIYLIEGLFYGF